MAQVRKVSFHEAKHVVIDDSTDLQEIVEGREEVARLREALRRIPKRERQVICWRRGIAGSRELSVREVARRLGVSTGTAFKLEQRAISLLRADYGIADEPVAVEVAVEVAA